MRGPVRGRGNLSFGSLIPFRVVSGHQRLLRRPKFGLLAMTVVGGSLTWNRHCEVTKVARGNLRCLNTRDCHVGTEGVPPRNDVVGRRPPIGICHCEAPSGAVVISLFRFPILIRVEIFHFIRNNFCDIIKKKHRRILCLLLQI